MRIGVIVAMDKEFAQLQTLASDKKEQTVAGRTFVVGRIGENEIVMQKCGIGKVNAAIGAAELLHNYRLNAIINTGVAGGTGATNVLDIAVASAVAYHDVWCGPGTVPDQASGCPLMLPCAFDPACLPMIEGAKFGPIISGDIFVSRPEEVSHILSVDPDALAVDMESAAIAQVCYLKNVPFICMRVISDTPGVEDNISQYENFWTDAPRHTFEALKSLLATI